MQDDDLDTYDDSANDADYAEDVSTIRKASKQEAARRREIKDKLEMLAWKREYGLSDDDFNSLMS